MFWSVWVILQLSLGSINCRGCTALTKGCAVTNGRDAPMLFDADKRHGTDLGMRQQTRVLALLCLDLSYHRLCFHSLLIALPAQRKQWRRCKHTPSLQKAPKSPHYGECCFHAYKLRLFLTCITRGKKPNQTKKQKAQGNHTQITIFE